MADTIGTAYVQIEPSFEGVVPKIDKEFGGAGEEGGKSFSTGFGSVLGTVGKVAIGAAAAGTAAVTGMVKSAYEGFSNYQQLVGGVETLFEDMSYDVIENAKNAYKTAGLSANDYMETVMSFSASLNQSLLRQDGNISRSADLANKAIVDMSDNANKMGTSMESIQNAYQGFAKQNYTMLDNLKLGYGGTKTEMERLLADASKLAGTKFDISNYSDIIEAIHVVQQEMGITGTTAEEAAETVTGSMASVQAAWENVLTAMGTGEIETISANINDLVATAQTYASNMLPVVQNALEGVSTLIEKLGPEIAKALPDLIKNVLPGLMRAGVDIIKTLGGGLIKAIPDLMPAITEVVLDLCRMLIDMLPELIQVGLQVILELALGITKALPELIPALVDTVLAIAEYLIDNVDLLVDASIALIVGLAEGLINALPKLIQRVPEIVIALVEAIIRNAPKILQAGLELILMLVKGIVDAFNKLIEVGRQIVDNIKDGFWQKIEEARNWGSDMIQNFIDGIMAKWNALKESVSNVAGTIKSFLHFSEPDVGPLKDFHTYAPDMMRMFAQGITDNVGLVKNALTDATSEMMGTSVDMNAIQTVNGSLDVQSGSDTIIQRIERLLSEYLPNVNQNIYLDTGVLVGATAGPMNGALGTIGMRSGKR